MERSREMQFLSRGPGEAIHIGPKIQLKLTAVRGERVRLRIESPLEVPLGRTRCGASRFVDVAAHPPVQLNRLTAVAESTRQGRPLRVMLADDCLNDRLQVRALLPTHRELVVFETETHLAALASIEWMQPDLVLLGTRAPECDGVGQLELLRKVWRAPLVLLAPTRCLATATRALQAGAVDYLTKQEVTAHALERYLKTAERWRPAPQAVAD